MLRRHRPEQRVGRHVIDRDRQQLTGLTQIAVEDDDPIAVVRPVSCSGPLDAS